MFTPYYDLRKAAVTFFPGWWFKLKRYHYKFLCHTALHLAFQLKGNKGSNISLNIFPVVKKQRDCGCVLSTSLMILLLHWWNEYTNGAAGYEQWINQKESMVLDFTSTMVNIKSSHAGHITVQYIQDLQPPKANIWSWPCSNRKMTTGQFNQLSSP